MSLVSEACNVLERNNNKYWGISERAIYCNTMGNMGSWKPIMPDNSTCRQIMLGQLYIVWGRYRIHLHRFQEDFWQNLLYKLRVICIDKNILLWLNKILISWFFSERGNGEESELCRVYKEVTKGSRLGPSLFFVHINDLLVAYNCRFCAQTILIADERADRTMTVTN